MPNLVASLNRAPVFRWYVVRCNSENKSLKDMCLNKIGLRAQDGIERNHDI